MREDKFLSAHHKVENASPQDKVVRRRPDFFGTFAAATARAAGGRFAFALALFVVLVWAVAGPYFHYSDFWQLVINTTTSIVTLLMVFLIQNTQNRESKAIHLKLDELIHALRQADNKLIKVETLTEEQLDLIAERYVRLNHRLCQALDREARERPAESATSA
jgi:low affinity Fe/Cu permease